jgi:hypothetical protein
VRGLCSFFILAGFLFAQDADHLQDYKNKLIWKGPLAKTAASALFGEIIDSPKEWGQGIEGFGKRAGSSFGKRAVKATVELGVSEWTHEDLHYHRLGSGSFVKRLTHAIVTTYWVPRDNGPGHTLAAGRIAGSFAAPQVARLWMPDRVANFQGAVRSTVYSMGLDAGLNVIYEFWRRPR